MRAAVREAAGGQVAIPKVAPSRLLELAGGASRLLELAGGASRLLELAGGASGGWAGRYTKSCPKSSPVQEAQRLVGRSLYQKLPQVVSSEEALLLDV